MSKISAELRRLRRQIATLQKEVTQLRVELAAKPPVVTHVVVQPAWIPPQFPLPGWVEPMRPTCVPAWPPLGEGHINPPHWPTTVCRSGDAVIAGSARWAS